MARLAQNPQNATSIDQYPKRRRYRGMGRWDITSVFISPVIVLIVGQKGVNFLISCNDLRLGGEHGDVTKTTRLMIIENVYKPLKPFKSFFTFYFLTWNKPQQNKWDSLTVKEKRPNERNIVWQGRIHNLKKENSSTKTQRNT